MRTCGRGSDWSLSHSNQKRDGGTHMKKTIEQMKRFLKDEEGTTAVEYGVMLGLIAAALITGISLLSGAVQGEIGRVTTAITAQ